MIKIRKHEWTSPEIRNANHHMVGVIVPEDQEWPLAWDDLRELAGSDTDENEVDGEHWQHMGITCWTIDGRPIALTHSWRHRNRPADLTPLSGKCNGRVYVELLASMSLHREHMIEWPTKSMRGDMMYIWTQEVTR